MARSGRNAAFIATSDHNGVLMTGCDRPGSSCLHALRLRRQRGPAPHRRDALPPARTPLASRSWSPVDLRPQLKPSKTRCVPFAERRHRRRQAGGSHRSAGAAGSRGPGLPAPSAPPHRSVPHEREPPPPPCSPILRSQGRARRGRGTAVTPPVPCLQESRARRGHVLAPQPIAENAVQEQGGCGERPTKTGDVFKPGPGGIRGYCSGGDTGSGGHPEALDQGLNPSAPAEPRVRASQGGVATRGEEGGRGFESVPGTREETLSSVPRLLPGVR